MIAINIHSGMNCQQADHWMCLYLANDISFTEELKERLDTHLRCCPGCLKLCKQYQVLHRAFRAEILAQAVPLPRL